MMDLPHTSPLIKHRCMQNHVETHSKVQTSYALSLKLSNHEPS